MSRLVTTLAIITVLVVTGILAGCQKKSETDANNVTITFWHSFVASTQPALKELIQRFEKEHPGIHIDAQYIPTGDGLIQKLMSSIQTGTSPDLCWVHSDFLDKLVESDAIYPMDFFIHGPDSLSGDRLADIHPGLLQAGAWRDTLYALPMEGTLLSLFYNKTLFKESGLDPNRPPQTWDELKTYAVKLTRDTDADGRNDQFGFYVPVFPASGPLNIWMNLQWATFLWQAGGIEINPEQTQVMYDSPSGVAALTYWRDLNRAMGSPTFSMSHDVSFVSGRIAMILDGPWDLPKFREVKNLDWGIAPLPAGPERQVTYLAGEHLSIFKQSKHPDEAWTFVKWILQPEVQAFFSERSGYLPVTRSTLDLPEYRNYLERDPALKAFVEQIPLGQPRTAIDYHRVEINRHMAEAIENTIIGGKDPASELKRSAEKSNALLGQRGK